MQKHREHIEGIVSQGFVLSDDRNLPPEAISFADCRYLLHQVHSAQRERGIKSILFLSQFPKEGKTLLSSMLAQAAVTLLGQRVLIVDIESSSPRPPTRSLSPDRSSRACPLQEAGALDVVSAKTLGHDSPSSRPEVNRSDPNLESLSNTTTSDFDVGTYITSVHEHYDLILIDGCSLRAVDQNTFHPWILACYTDSIIVVISPASIDRRALTSLKQEIAQQRAQPLGFVFNQGAGA